MESIVNFISDVVDTINDSKFVLAVFIDLKKDFDTVDQNILLSINKRKTISWIENYMTNRFHRTICNGNLLGYNQITCGVPQGSIQGPLLFIIHS